MKNIVKKLLATTAAVVVMSGSLGVGTLRVLAEQYYGWNDGTREQSPFFLYVSPTSDPKRELKDEYVVYCFNRDREWPENWNSGKTFEETQLDYQFKLPLYRKSTGNLEIFKQNASNPRLVSNIEKSLVAVLQKGYPTVKKIQGLSELSSRKVTQLAIWFFSDNQDNPDAYLQTSEKLTPEERKAFDSLVEEGKKAGESQDSMGAYTLDIYITTDKNYAHKPYQNLLGSTLIPKTPEEPKVPEPKEPEQPQPSTPDINVEIIKPEIPTEPLVEPMLPLQPAIPIIPKPEIPKEEDLGTVIGGGNVVETTEDTATGSQGGAHNGVVSIQENKDPIVEETYDSPLPGQSGQSGSTTEIEDTKGSDVIVGGQGQIVETEESLSGEQGQSGSTTEVEDTKGPEVIIGGQGEVVDIEESLPTEHGQSGSTTEVEDTKGPEVIIGGQGEVVDIEETLPTEHGQSGSTTEVEDTKGPEVIIGGQGEIVDIEENLPTEHGQSGSTTEVEDSKPKLSIHFDNEWPKEDKPQLPAVEKPKAKESLPAAGEAEHVLSTIVGAMILFLVSLWGLLKRKASKA
ncbi:fibronectin binding protein [Streptococcus dysgalactiae]|uniref:thioester-forming surface-anchored protein n=1 Tax=Streptococcus dysgalactiae TaxID=1334 RepID=UPI000DF87BB4|nr:thioester-forming surface-anchored protein [Streptococcus dysgalactiae]QQT03452.1 fibronectin binding protein [Streptococcus dysgalactiae]SUN48032.1 Muscle M-line assembly protein unc-89 [Streptococcus dysgalactiae subsp. dysgalactiae]SUN52198.1 Muscle M-line assembly protein unc-89 [Streptococcus dysgalactiae]SUN56201.1 Muscle M-line assembly protein unc-89 [Streptococcus dysgalactiae]